MVAVAMPALSAIAADEGHHGGMGAVMGVTNMAMSAGMMLGPVLAGGLAEIIGLRGLFVFAGVVGVSGTAAFGWLTTEHDTTITSTAELVERRPEVS
jgi:MFS family permease